MEQLKFPFERIPQLSKRDIAYQNNPDLFRDFFFLPSDLESFSEAIANKSKQDIDRTVLVSELKNDYSILENTEMVLQNIDRLKRDQCFSICTAHQPSLFTGPLYYIIKICSAIKASRILSQKHPEYQFVPVFVHGSEDHDFEEINHLHLFNKKLEWYSDQEGPTGRMKLKGLQNVIDQLSDILGEGEYDKLLRSFIQSSLDESKTYGEFMFRFVHHLFGNTGLVQVQMDKPSFKKLFIPIMEEELVNQSSIELVEQAQNQLEELGFSAQAFARPINLFYLGDGGRSRILEQNGNYSTIDEKNQWSQEEILILLRKHPEHFSPNVILRPLFQELILPNLTYIGGGGEIAYWLERKSVFEKHNIAFPILTRRDSVMLLDQKTKNQFENLGFELENIFLSPDDLIKRFVGQSDLAEHISVEDQRRKLKQIFDDIAEQATVLDQGYAKSILAEGTRQMKALDNIENRLRKIVKQREEQHLRKLSSIKERFFPGQSLQERKENFIPFYLKMGPSFIEELIEQLNPFDTNFKVLIY